MTTCLNCHEPRETRRYRYLAGRTTDLCDECHGILSAMFPLVPVTVPVAQPRWLARLQAKDMTEVA
jgi:predicted CXXCH cytochrome family protein